MYNYSWIDVNMQLIQKNKKKKKKNEGGEGIKEKTCLLSGENMLKTIFTPSLRLCLEAKECASYKEVIYDGAQ